MLENLPAPVALAEIRCLCQSGDARRIRERADVSLRELARQLGVDSATVSRWERGEQKPTGEAAIAYLAQLHSLARARGGSRLP